MIPLLLNCKNPKEGSAMQLAIEGSCETPLLVPKTEAASDPVGRR